MKRTNVSKNVKVIFHKSKEGEGYWVDSRQLPGCFTEGDNLVHAAEMWADALKVYLE